MESSLPFEELWSALSSIREYLSTVDDGLVPPVLDLELSHHYGLALFHTYGATSFWLNGKKILIIIPGQTHPAHYHEHRDERHRVLCGEAQVEIDGQGLLLSTGGQIDIPRLAVHKIRTENGIIIEETFSSMDVGDSIYSDAAIPKDGRKTTVQGFSL